MVSTPPTKDQRRSPRFRHELLVELHEKQRTRKLYALDVGRHGLFLATDDPPHERHLVQLTVHLPEGPIRAAASVMRTIKGRADVDGVGVQFFALSGIAKQRWDDFIFALHRTTPPRGVAAVASISPPATEAHVLPLPPTSQPPTSQAPTSQPPASQAPTSQPPSQPTSQPTTSRPPVTAAPVPHLERDPASGATFLVKLKSIERLREFAATHLAAGGTVLYTPVLHAEGEVLTLIVVHPKSDEEFRLPGIIHKAHTDRPKRLEILFHGVTPAVLRSFDAYIASGLPPAVQLEPPRPLNQDKEIEELDLDVDVFDEEPIEIDDRVWREAGELSGLKDRPEPRPAPPPTTHPAADPGLKPTTFRVRCAREGSGCSAEPYAVDLGPCRGVLGLVADHAAFLSHKTGRIVTAPRFVTAEAREERARAFVEKGGTLEAPVDVATLLAVAALASPVTDPQSGAPLKQTRAVERLEAAALRLTDGEPPAKTRVACATCKEGQLTIERAPT
jgi:hypothetical protein